MKKIPNPISKSADDSIILNMKRRNYHLAIVFLSQLEHELGHISLINQCRYVECLYSMGKYLDALQLAKKYVAAGNEMKNLKFLMGLCLFYTKNYTAAKEIFETQDTWNRWAMKCVIKAKIEQNKQLLLVLNDPQRPPDPSRENFQFTQDGKTGTIKILINGCFRHQVRFIVLPHSLDIEIDTGTFIYEKSFELYEEIDANTWNYNITPSYVELTFQKIAEQEWPSLTKSEHEILAPDLSIQSISDNLKTIPDYTDQEAAQLFEAVQNELLPQNHDF